MENLVSIAELFAAATSKRKKSLRAANALWKTICLVRFEGRQRQRTPFSLKANCNVTANRAKIVFNWLTDFSCRIGFDWHVISNGWYVIPSKIQYHGSQVWNAIKITFWSNPLVTNIVRFDKPCLHFLLRHVKSLRYSNKIQL